ncbi:MAG: flavodoxin family protein [Clostridia bacterium]|nr:flavodoxin family protein [Clostridia bacterium]
MKKILIVNGSKRKKGNSYALEAYMAGKLAGKAEVVEFNVGEKDVRVCMACDACKKKEEPFCIQKDDFTALIPEIDKCDAMVILGPVHYGRFPAQLRAFLDRTYSFMNFKRSDFSMASRKDKKIAGYLCCGVGPADVYVKALDEDLRCFAMAGFVDYKAYVAGGVGVPGSVMENPDYVKAADDIVDWLLA